MTGFWAKPKKHRGLQIGHPAPYGPDGSRILHYHAGKRIVWYSEGQHPKNQRKLIKDNDVELTAAEIRWLTLPDYDEPTEDEILVREIRRVRG